MAADLQRIPIVQKCGLIPVDRAPGHPRRGLPIHHQKLIGLLAVVHDAMKRSHPLSGKNDVVLRVAADIRNTLDRCQVVELHDSIRVDYF